MVENTLCVSRLSCVNILFREVLTFILKTAPSTRLRYGHIATACVNDISGPQSTCRYWP